MMSEKEMVMDQYCPPALPPSLVALNEQRTDDVFSMIETFYVSEQLVEKEEMS